VGDNYTPAESLPGEAWKPVQGHEGYYMVSSLGRICSLSRVNAAGLRITERIMNPSRNNRGYLTATLHKHRKVTPVRVHRVVAIAFVLGYKPSLQVNHKNGIKSDNRAENLEWVTHRENSTHSFRIGVQTKRTNSVMIRIIRQLRGRITQKEIADIFGLCPGYVSDIQLGKVGAMDTDLLTAMQVGKG
jgi:hypothetical protein